MTILNEAGTPDTVSPLYCIGHLGEALPHALFVVVGTRAEAFAARTLLSTFGPDCARTAYVVLDPEPPERGALAAEVGRAARRYRECELCILVVGRTARLLGIDLSGEAGLIERRLHLAVHALELPSGGFTTSLEDSALAALLRRAPADAPGREEGPPKERGGFLSGLLGRRPEDSRTPGLRPVVLAGRASPDCRRRLAGELEQAGLEVAGFIPSPPPEEMPPVGPETVVAPLQPYLTETLRAAQERGAGVVHTLAPVGVDGTARFIRDVARAAGREINELARAREALAEVEGLRNRLRGLRVFLTGDTGLEIPLARTLAGAGAVILEVGTPRIARPALVPELQTLGVEIDIVEAPEWTRQIERVEESRPDLVIAGPGLYAPLTARGHLCRLSLDFLSGDIYGYAGARRLLELFITPLDRASKLDALEL
ncbi:hypothetical protein E0L93_11090 [Rubrobacter taiwanensis]|uniref:Nitrogenase/oxidoreductase component 1 domain-containing protein n=1 Tax=Rubrobacter taiwanensis TaxID=185139 RepID=A0A4R1BFS5_9ACTN|nr:nitrogenase component 1 [Rubrobacter taiwanensis]TCJ16021.1 hypothetical protein E0L93_11090 [Rubrobacter taiwanensis]